MTTCQHKKHKKESVTREILGESFVSKSLVCSDCGAASWDEFNQKEFKIWLEKLHRERRDKFQVQFPLNRNLRSCLNQLLQVYPSTKESELIRALVVAFEHISKNRKLMKFIEENIDKNVIQSFKEGEFSYSKVQLKPNAMIEYTSLAKMIGMTMPKFIEMAVQKLMAFFVTHDPKLKEFWDKEIKALIDMFLKAA